MVKRYFCQINRQVGIILLLVSGLFFVGCRDKDTQKQKEGALNPVSRKVRVQTLVVKTREVFLSRSFSGQVQAKRHILLSSKISGYVTKCKVQEGDFVKPGQTLLTLDDRELRDQIRSVDSQVKQILRQRAGVEARLAYARANFKRFSKLYAEQAATKEEYERVRSEFKALQAQEEALQAQAGAMQARKGELESLLSYARIKAPVSGWVVQKFVDMGSFAPAGQPLLAIDNQDLGFWFEAHVDESMLPKVRKGQEVQVVIPALDLQMAARLRVLVPRIDPWTRTFKVKVDLGNLSEVQTGMYGRVYLPLGARERLLVPAKSLFRRGQLDGVYVPDDQGVVQLRVLRLGKWFEKQSLAGQEWFVPVSVSRSGPVRLQPKAGKDGQQGELWVEVLSGLNSGERVVNSNLQGITEGMVLE